MTALFLYTEIMIRILFLLVTLMSFSAKADMDVVCILGNYGFDDDNQILTILPQENNELRFNVQLKGDKMMLGFIDCIEECSYRYRRRN